MNQQDRNVIKTLSITIGILAFLAIVIWFIAGQVASTDQRTEQDRAALQLAQSATRLAPVGKVVLTGSDAASNDDQQNGNPPVVATEVLAGADVVNNHCSICHGNPGIPGSPKIGIQADWQPRYDQGFDTLLDHAINGFTGSSGVMPARGGVADLSDGSIRNAVLSMLNDSEIDTSAITHETPTADSNEIPDPQPTDDQPANAELASSKQTPTATDTDINTAATDATPASVAAVTAATPFALPAGVDIAAGEDIYKITCFVCHDNGVANAPKPGDSAAWTPRTAQGWDKLVEHALQGFQGMPPKGGRMDLPDDAVVNAIGFMLQGV